MSRGQKPDDLGRCQSSTMHVFVHLPHEAQQSTFPDARKATQLPKKHTIHNICCGHIIHTNLVGS